MDCRVVLMVLAIFVSFSYEKRLIGRQKFLDDVETLIYFAGYKSEVHQTETSDGYKLKIHRILPKRTSWLTRYPVFFMHGLFGTASDFLMTGAEIALPYLLSDHGYDVWMGNSRGNDHSLQHKSLSSKSKKYWDFSWHEIGFYDVPTMINYILKVKNVSRTFYVGHSQGTTSLLVMLSLRPEFNQKIIQAHLMAPAAFMKNMPNQLAKLFINEVEAFINEFGFYDFLANTNLMKFAETINLMICQQTSPTIGLCESTITVICGSNTGELQLDTRILADYIKHIAHTVSIKQVNHFFQLHSSGKFRQYDYQQGNQKIYNSSSPPDYNLSNVKAPTYLYSGRCDALVSELDVQTLRELLPNVKKYKSIRNYNHCDFNYGKNSREVLFHDIVKTMNSETRQ